MYFQNRGRTFLKSFFMVVFLLLGIMTSPLLAVEPKEILSLSLEAQFQLDFEGIQKTQIYIKEESYTVVVKFIYQKPDFSYIRYLAPSKIEGRIILDDGKMRIDYVPDMDKSHISFSLNSSRAKERKKQSLNLIFDNYIISQLPDEYIRERPVYVILLTPKYAGNPWLKIWIDKETYLSLKQEKYASEKKLITSSAFTEVYFGIRSFREELYSTIPSRLWEGKKLPSRRIIRSLEQLREEITFPLSLPRYLPPGYGFRGAILFKEGRRVDLIYNNGLKIIVFSQGPKINVRMRDYHEMSFKEKLGRLQASK
ncbi:hypothetical protein E3J84_00950, partial [Candidatus Aerophobetes bacterium]